VGDPGHGKALFIKDCAACHTLADAGTQGTLGPNLDDAFSSDKQQGFSLSTIRDVVRGQISIPDAPMPANLVTGTDAVDVAAYVAECSGNPQCGVTATQLSPVGTPATTTPTTTSTTTSTTAGGGGPSAKLAEGKQVFASAGCGGCHTLKDAGATGAVGPNLDTLKRPAARVVRQVTNGGAIMPAFKDKLTAAQIQAVAAYVAAVAGK
jgi:mono/diheme cytochrome c family protein